MSHKDVDLLKVDNVKIKSEISGIHSNLEMNDQFRRRNNVIISTSWTDTRDALGQVRSFAQSVLNDPTLVDGIVSCFRIGVVRPVQQRPLSSDNWSNRASGVGNNDAVGEELDGRDLGAAGSGSEIRDSGGAWSG